MADEVECKSSSVKIRGTDGNYLKTLLPKDLERYQEKLKITLDGEKLIVNNPYESWDDEKHWNNHPTSWPNIQFGDIWIYLVESPGPFTKERLKCYKSLLAYDYFISRKVGPVFTHEISSKQEEGAIKVLKAEVRPGQAESKNSYLPWIICKKSGEIITAHCDCKAGLGETCSHAASIMFKVETAVKMGLTTDACTSKACRWNAVFGNDSLTAPVDEINFQKAKKGETTPRLEVSSTNRKPLACSSGDYMFMEAYSGFFQELKAICPNACVFKSLPKFDEEETDTACSEDNFQDDESGDESDDEQYTLFIKPNSYNNTSMHPVAPPGPPPFPLTGERLKKWGILPSDLTPHELNYVKTLSVDYNEAHKFQCDTQKQSDCPLWFKLRKPRITASKFGIICEKMSKPRARPKLVVRDILTPKNTTTYTERILNWGKDNESIAAQVYAGVPERKHVQLFECGLFISPENPHLAVTPDRVCYDSLETKPWGIIEIKCPYTSRDVTPKSAAESSTFMSTFSDGVLKLRKDHHYYLQVQGQMAITGATWCDFIIYTKKGLSVERIQFDEEFWKVKVNLLNKFFFKYFLPEYITFVEKDM